MAPSFKAWKDKQLMMAGKDQPRPILPSTEGQFNIGDTVIVRLDPPINAVIVSRQLNKSRTGYRYKVKGKFVPGAVQSRWINEVLLRKD